MPFIILLLLIIVHELGHFLTALFLNVSVDKIYIYPFGGISKLDIDYNESIIKEFIILIMGPIVQIIFTYIIVNIPYFYNYIDLIKNYSYTIVTFNLLPIYPLDGGKLLNLLLSIKISFKKSYTLSIYFSYLTIILIIILNTSSDLKFNMIILITFLLFKVSLEYKKRNYVFNKFLLERYINNYNFRRRKGVSDLSCFMRGKKHIIKNKGKYYTEKEVLSKKFGNKY